MVVLGGGVVSYERGTPVAIEADRDRRRVVTARAARLVCSLVTASQGYLAHKKQRPPRTLQWECA